MFGHEEVLDYVPLEHHQKMIDWLVARKEAGLFGQPGLGKTGATLKAADEFLTSGYKGMLVVAPIRVCSITWPKEVRKWSFSHHLTVADMRTPKGIRHWERGTADIYLINSERLPTREVRVKCPECKDLPDQREDCIECEGDGKLTKKYPGFVAKFLKGRKAKDLPVDILCIDELSLAKSHTSKRFNALRAHRDKFKVLWGLTGTPAPNSYIDLFAQIRLLDDGERLGVSPGEYRRIYFNQTGERQFNKFHIKKGGKEQIEEKISDLCLIMLSEDYLDVPTCNYTDEEVVLPPKAMKEYKTLKKELLLEIESGEIEALNAAALTQKLLQITGGAVYDAEKEVHELHDTKIKALKDIVKRHKGEPVLVLTQFKHERRRILKAIPQAREFDEKDLGKWRKKEIPVWVADCRSLSHGIDGIQDGGRIAVWFTLTYSNESFIQTNARLIRTGQSMETIVYRIIATGTVDEAVAEALREKDDRQNGLFAALKALQQMETASS